MASRSPKPNPLIPLLLTRDELAELVGIVAFYQTRQGEEGDPDAVEASDLVMARVTALYEQVVRDNQPPDAIAIPRETAEALALYFAPRLQFASVADHVHMRCLMQETEAHGHRL